MEYPSGAKQCLFDSLLEKQTRLRKDTIITTQNNQANKRMIENRHRCMGKGLHRDPGIPVLPLLEDFGRRSLREEDVSEEMILGEMSVAFVYLHIEPCVR